MINTKQPLQSRVECVRTGFRGDVSYAFDYKEFRHGHKNEHRRHKGSVLLIEPCIIVIKTWDGENEAVVNLSYLQNDDNKATMVETSVNNYPNIHSMGFSYRDPDHKQEIANWVSDKLGDYMDEESKLVLRNTILDLLAVIELKINSGVGV